MVNLRFRKSFLQQWERNLDLAGWLVAFLQFISRCHTRYSRLVIMILHQDLWAKKNISLKCLEKYLATYEMLSQPTVPGSSCGGDSQILLSSFDPVQRRWSVNLTHNHNHHVQHRHNYLYQQKSLGAGLVFPVRQASLISWLYHFSWLNFQLIFQLKLRDSWPCPPQIQSTFPGLLCLLLSHHSGELNRR